jgi:aldehyde dehydrogenase (NAD+)
MTQKIDMFIGGNTVPPASGEYFDTINPADGSVLAQLPRGNSQDVEQAVQAASDAAESWAATDPTERGKILKRLAALIEADAERLGKIESDDMGMPSEASPDIIRASAEFFEFYGGLTHTLQGNTLPTDPGKFVYTQYEPYGVVGVITPWNAPLNQAARSVAPALAAGNTVVLKPSEWASVTTLELGELAAKAGMPPGVLNVICGYGHEAGSPLVEHPLVSKVAFTGSVGTGQAIGRAAADKVMPVTLELRGKSPNIVFEDANLEAAIPMVLFGFIANSGQICSSGTRVLVQRSIYEKFSQMIAGAAQQIPIGRDETFPTLGPIANRMQYEKVLGYFESARQEGATILTGGEPATGDDLDDGLYIKPTVFADVTMDMKVVKEEIFGPAGVLIPFDTEEEAVQIANDTEYGLCSGLWTQDVSRAHRVASKIKAGTVYVNTYHDHTVSAPVGGYKKSGIGRERGIQALQQYSQVKNVTMHLI